MLVVTPLVEVFVHLVMEHQYADGTRDVHKLIHCDEVRIYNTLLLYEYGQSCYIHPDGRFYFELMTYIVEVATYIGGKNFEYHFVNHLGNLFAYGDVVILLTNNIASSLIGVTLKYLIVLTILLSEHHKRLLQGDVSTAIYRMNGGVVVKMALCNLNLISYTLLKYLLAVIK